MNNLIQELERQKRMSDMELIRITKEIEKRYDVAISNTEEKTFYYDKKHKELDFINFLHDMIRHETDYDESPFSNYNIKFENNIIQLSFIPNDCYCTEFKYDFKN